MLKVGDKFYYIGNDGREFPVLYTVAWKSCPLSEPYVNGGRLTYSSTGNRLHNFNPLGVFSEDRYLEALQAHTLAMTSYRKQLELLLEEVTQKEEKAINAVRATIQKALERK